MRSLDDATVTLSPKLTHHLIPTYLNEALVIWLVGWSHANCPFKASRCEGSWFFLSVYVICSRNSIAHQDNLPEITDTSLDLYCGEDDFLASAEDAAEILSNLANGVDTNKDDFIDIIGRFIPVYRNCNLFSF